MRRTDRLRSRARGRSAVLLAAAAVAAFGSDAGGGVSPGEASGLVAFARHDGVYVLHLDGGEARRVWRGARPPTDVTWSPDGRRLAFVSGDALWVAAVNGRTPARVIAARDLRGTDLWSPTWSPDGRRIAFTLRQGVDRDLWVVRVGPHEVRRLTRTPRHLELEVDWSPDGRRLAVATIYAAAAIVGAAGGSVPDLWTMTADGRYERNLTPGRLQGRQPAWSPDGTRIAFTSWLGDAVGTGLYLARAGGGRVARLTHDSVAASGPSWAPDGRRIAFVRGGRRDAGYGHPPAQRGTGEIYVLDSASGRLVRLTRNRVDETSPAWQPALSGPP